MKKYWDLFSQISQLTHAGVLNWHEVDCQAHARQISKSWRVLRQFEAPFNYHGRPTTLICVEKPIYLDEDYLFPYEDRTCELLILDNEELLEEVAEPSIRWYWLKGLGSAIADACNRAAIPQQA